MLRTTYLFCGRTTEYQITHSFVFQSIKMIGVVMRKKNKRWHLYIFLPLEIIDCYMHQKSFWLKFEFFDIDTRSYL